MQMTGRTESNTMLRGGREGGGREGGGNLATIQKKGQMTAHAEERKQRAPQYSKKGGNLCNPPKKERTSSNPSNPLGSTRRHRAQDASLASANLQCEFKLIRLIPRCRVLLHENQMGVWQMTLDHSERHKQQRAVACNPASTPSLSLVSL